jgi:hypothetical protein
MVFVIFMLVALGFVLFTVLVAMWLALIIVQFVLQVFIWVLEFCVWLTRTPVPEVPAHDDVPTIELRKSEWHEINQ